jgi:uncharacterized protein YjiS (DUF1127 family)
MTMAYATETRALGMSLAQWIAAVRAALAERMAAYSVYRRTLRELEALSDRELADIGISRDMIGDIARDAAYRN